MSPAGTIAPAPSTFNSQPSTIIHQPSTKRTRPARRRAVHRALRSGPRRATHPVLPDRGPSLNSLLALCNRSIRQIERLHKKLNPPSRFKTLCTPEELARRFDEDLQRAYGPQSPLAPHTPTPGAAPAVASSPSSPGPGSQPSTLNAQPIPKRDVMAVPLVRSPNGLWTLDWRAARPA